MFPESVASEAVAIVPPAGTKRSSEEAGIGAEADESARAAKKKAETELANALFPDDASESEGCPE